MSEQDILFRAKTLLTGITPGKWVYDNTPTYGKIITHKPFKIIGGINHAEDMPHEANGEFIAASPELVEKLCDAVEALEEDLESTQKNLGEYSGFFNELCAELEKRFPVEYAALKGDEYGDDAFTVHDLFDHVLDAVTVARPVRP